MAESQCWKVAESCTSFCSKWHLFPCLDSPNTYFLKDAIKILPSSSQETQLCCRLGIFCSVFIRWAQQTVCNLHASLPFSGWISGNISSPKEWSGTGTAAQGSSGVIIPGGVPEPWRCGTEGRGQWAWWGALGLDLGISEHFSNRNHRIAKVGKDLEDHPVQPSTYHQYLSLNHIPMYSV